MYYRYKIKFIKQKSSKIFLIMRLAVYLILLGLLPIHANVYSQNASMNVDVDDLPMRDALRKIEKESGMRFFMSDDLDVMNEQISLHVTDQSFEQVMNLILNKYGLSYRIYDNDMVIITEKGMFKQGITISGAVTDEAGEPMPGVNVVVKGSLTGTVTDVGGKYRINVPNTAAELSFTFIGYGEQTITVGDQFVIDVTMIEGAIALREVEISVDIGYGGNIRARDITGSVGVVNVSEIQKMPVLSAVDALAGRISGLQVISADGTPGQGSNIVIRGGNSITGDNNPLIVVDGFPDGSLHSIDPSQIESIVVLKDASSTAIYGSRGANGVILVTTKRGTVGKPVVSYSGIYGTNVVTKRMDVMSPYDYVAMEYERDPYVANRTFLRDRSLESYRNEPGVNWEDHLLRTAWTQNHTLSLRGGTETTKYNFTGAYWDQDGIIIESNYKRYFGKIDLDQQLNKWMRGGVSVQYTRNIYSGVRPSTQDFAMVYYTMYNTWGYMPVSTSGLTEDLLNDLYDPDGLDIGLNTWFINPVISTKNEYLKNMTNSFSANAYLDFTITNNLKFRSIGRVSQNMSINEVFNNSLTRTGHPRTSRMVNGSVLNSESHGWVNENILTYNKKLTGGHVLTATGAVTFEKSGGSSNGYSSEHVPNEKKGMAGLAEGSVYSSSSSINTGIRRMSFLGRVIYDYRTRYLATVSMRADASTMFEKANRWGYFPSASVAWRFSAEEFMRGQKILSNGKLRVSWGLTGNDRISSDDRYAQMTTPSSSRYPLGDDWQTFSYISNPGNPDLRWEKTIQTNLGVDLAFLRDRITIVADVYRKNTVDLLLDAQMPGSTGYASMRMNIGEVRNQGLEITLTTVNIKNKSFEWVTNFNIAFNQNKVIKLAFDQESILRAVSWDQDYNNAPPYIAELGGPVGQIFGYVWDRLYRPDDFYYGANGLPMVNPGIPVYANNIQPGDIRYRDVNGDGAVDDGDRQIIGNTAPNHLGGINNMFYWKGFDVSIFFRWSYGNDVLNANRLAMERANRPLVNQFASFANRWSADNQDTDMYRLGSNGLTYYSSRVVEDASFLRLQSVALGYTFPKAWLQKVYVSKARMSLAANNLYVWTNYSGYDPEVSVRHTAMTPGFDFSAYPRARTISLTLNLEF